MPYSISVILSTYNDRCLVDKKLDEIRQQTLFNESEFIFVETGSPGRERELLEPFCNMHRNCRLITRDERKTLYEAWNIGWDAATAPLLCYSNMDDCMHPALLEQVVKAMNRHHWDACSVLIAKQALSMEPRQDMWSLRHLSSLELSHRPGPFTAWRKTLAEKVGKFDPEFYAAGDKDFWSRLLASKLRFGIVRKVLYIYSKSDQQLSKSDAGKQQRNHDKALAAAKPYPYRWPYRKFPYYTLLLLAFRLYPKGFYIPTD
jgi:glycosyltransferase involved in cell wall biosynthesis